MSFFSANMMEYEDKSEKVQKIAIRELDRKQMDLARAKMKRTKDARQQAKLEEKNWVEFRKLQVLYDCQPKSRAASRRDDDSFPRRRRGVSMGFGERKAYFLAIRPNPRYATWFGKKKNWQTKEKRKGEKYTKEKGKTKSAESTARSQVYCIPVAREERTMDVGTLEKEDDDPNAEKKGNHALNPLVNGIPFWITPEEEEEPNEEDLPIDRELIEKVLDGTFNIASNTVARKRFDPYSETESYKKLDKFFTRELIIGDTVKTVINLLEEPNDDGTKKSNEKPLVTWGTKVLVSTFDVANRKVTVPENLQTEPLKDIVRTSSVKDF
ncbi:hypothetical protein Y032_0065g3631 [Ancylostoma ceylanicum]|uniref:Uncharacterized protein n=3 Tax=Ancylostoma ceylanicum TaxID=53326 RepID=A0A016U1Y1_9BILA|nr:hypothetical protein Y032_0065g3631 [Ancylostoma ceylanicum]